MKLIVGLGNPGRKYEKTRHNVGFHVIDAICKKENIELTKTKFNAAYEKYRAGDEDVLLVKPLTYMNLSGEAVAPIANFYKVDHKDILIIYDDMDLPAGKMRLRGKGSAGGQNGMKSIIAQLGTKELKRIRIGIGRPEGRESVINYVLKPFVKEQKEDVSAIIDNAADACLKWIDTPFEQVMNQYNR